MGPLFLIAVLWLGQAHAQKKASLMDHLIYEMQVRQELSGKKRSKPFDQIEGCYKIYKEAKNFWQDGIAKKKSSLLVEGQMSKSFTRDEIINMKNTPLHNQLYKVRGTDQYLSGGYSLGGSPPFPHTRPGCEKTFKEEIKVIDVGIKKCRQIKFTQDGKDDVSYYQMYCQDSPKIWMNFHPDNQFVGEEVMPEDQDCVHCGK